MAVLPEHKQAMTDKNTEAQYDTMANETKYIITYCLQTKQQLTATVTCACAAVMSCIFLCHHLTSTVTLLIPQASSSF